MGCERVNSAVGLENAIRAGTLRIEIAGQIGGLPPLALAPAQTLAGVNNEACLSFLGDGLLLAGDNRLDGLHIACLPDATALAIAPDSGPCGRIEIRQCRCDGVVQLVLTDTAADAELIIDGLAISNADATQRLPRPQGNGVEVQQGALTIWNQSATATTLGVTANNIVIGSIEQPVRGTGLFVAGNETGTGGRVVLRQFSTGAVSSDSALPEGTTGTVAGGIFFLVGVYGETVETLGDITTMGANAVPVDNWGELARWRVDGNARSYGPSAVGMVNAGRLDRCEIAGAIETFGDGARGCCIYGPTGSIEAAAIRTHGKAASGLQVVNRLDSIRLSEGIFTDGAPGEGLMKGQMMSTPAHGVEVESGGWLGELDVGTICVTGTKAAPIHAADGAIARILRQS